jgi:hypothetical protein
VFELVIHTIFVVIGSNARRFFGLTILIYNQIL